MGVVRSDAFSLGVTERGRTLHITRNPFDVARGLRPIAQCGIRLAGTLEAGMREFVSDSDCKNCQRAAVLDAGQARAAALGRD